MGSSTRRFKQAKSADCENAILRARLPCYIQEGIRHVFDCLGHPDGAYMKISKRTWFAIILYAHAEVGSAVSTVVVVGWAVPTILGWKEAGGAVPTILGWKVKP